MNRIIRSPRLCVLQLVAVLLLVMGTSVTVTARPRAACGPFAWDYLCPRPTPTATPEPAATPAPPSEASSDFEAEVMRLTNEHRQAHGCAPLQQDDRLMRAAQRHADDMARNDFTSHTGSDGSSGGDRLTREGYRWSRWGENIAWGYTSPEAVVQAWMDSAGHRANILNCNFQHIGVGYTYLDPDPGAVRYKHYWVQDFGTPSAA